MKDYGILPICEFHSIKQKKCVILNLTKKPSIYSKYLTKSKMDQMRYIKRTFLSPKYSYPYDTVSRTPMAKTSESKLSNFSSPSAENDLSPNKFTKVPQKDIYDSNSDDQYTDDLETEEKINKEILKNSPSVKMK